MPVATTKVHFGGHCGRSAVALPQKGRSQNVTPPLASSSRPTALIRNTHRILFHRIQWPGNQIMASLILNRAPCRICMAVPGRRVERKIHLSATRCCFSHHRSWRGFALRNGRWKKQYSCGLSSAGVIWQLQQQVPPPHHSQFQLAFLSFPELPRA